jgi:signal transduction histidine kinase
MNAVVGLTELLKETRLTPEQLEMLETIEHSSESLLTIINDILDFSRLDSKKLVLESIPVNLREVCACVYLISVLIQARVVCGASTGAGGIRRQERVG